MFWPLPCESDCIPRPPVQQIVSYCSSKPSQLQREWHSSTKSKVESDPSQHPSNDCAAGKLYCDFAKSETEARFAQPDDERGFADEEIEMDVAVEWSPKPSSSSDSGYHRPVPPALLLDQGSLDRVEATIETLQLLSPVREGPNQKYASLKILSEVPRTPLAARTLKVRAHRCTSRSFKEAEGSHAFEVSRESGNAIGLPHNDSYSDGSTPSPLSDYIEIPDEYKVGETMFFPTTSGEEHFDPRLQRKPWRQGGA